MIKLNLNIRYYINLILNLIYIKQNKYHKHTDQLIFEYEYKFFHGFISFVVHYLLELSNVCLNLLSFLKG